MNGAPSSANRVRVPRRRIDGVLLLDKPAGLSSNAALQRAKRLYCAEKAGHTGTLDPLASGLLPLCFGEATKYAQALLDAPKRYTATVRFGTTTTTGDAEGAVVATTHAVSFGEADLEGALRAFTGRIAQTPPAFSALKYLGRAYYEYARAGVGIPRVPREVEIMSLRLLAFDGTEARIDVQCSKGTYVRVLAEDLGQALQCGAHLAALRRTATGAFDLANAVTLAALETLDAAALSAVLLPIDAPLAEIPRLELDAAIATDLIQGRRPASNVAAGRYRGYTPNGRFIGLIAATSTDLRAVRLVGSA